MFQACVIGTASYGSETYSAEQQRRGAADLAHVHSHTGDYANDRADSLANIGKGIGPYSQQLPIPLRLYGGVGISESDEDRDARIQTGDGYPHEAVPGKYCCVWATPEQVQKVGLAVQSAQPPLGRRKGYRTQQPPDFGSGVKGFGATKYTDFVGSLSGPPDRIASSRTIRVMQAPPGWLVCACVSLCGALGGACGELHCGKLVGRGL